jgi:deoxyribodipyrimidine photo-lyase
LKALIQNLIIKCSLIRYEQYAIKRDHAICELLQRKYSFFSLKTKSFEEKKLQDGCMHHLYNKIRLDKYNGTVRVHSSTTSTNFHKSNYVFPSLEEIGFEESTDRFPYNLKQISNYQERDFPAIDATSYLSPHLRLVR